MGLLGSASKLFKGLAGRKLKDDQSQALHEDTTEPNSCPPRPMGKSQPNHFTRGEGGEGDIRGAYNGFFSNAHDFIIKDSTMNKAETINYITNNIDSGKPVFDHLLPYTTPEAATDSRARYPPPRCHPGTRGRINSKLQAWSIDEQRQWKMVWLYGPAGVGKSAVAQTFAEYCDERGRLGAAFFFSRSNKRNNPDTIIPTLAYQLAIQCHEYRNLLAHQLVNNPLIPNAAMHVQLRKLIVDPFYTLQARGSPNARNPYLIILDGLDECKGEDPQCEIVDMIGEVIRLKKDLPLLWLVCSRPEPHLRYTFSKADFSVICERESLRIDEEAREEVDQYLRDSFKEIQARFPYTTSGSWPSQDQFTEVSHAASGLFIVASTVLRYVGDPKCANPPAQLDAFSSFVKSSHNIGVKNPLETLDLLYTRILSDISDDVLPIAKRILSHLLYIPAFELDIQLRATQALCNFLCLDQSTFYSALQRLHSVIDVPLPEAAAVTPLKFYHTSFEDYLRDPIRSGKFVIEGPKAFAEIAKSCLYWHEVDSTLYHTNDTPWRGQWRGRWRSHKHAALPGLKWTSGCDINQLTQCITKISDFYCWDACCRTSAEEDQDLLSQIHEFDFRYIEYNSSDLLRFANWLHRQQSDTNKVIRTEPDSVTDQRLIDHLMMEIARKLKPAVFPLPLDGSKRFYFLLGHGTKACLIYKLGQGLFKLNIDEVSQFDDSLQTVPQRVGSRRSGVQRQRRRKGVK